MPVTHEEIAALAYRFWKERGEPEGTPEVDWERAEATLQLKTITLVQTALQSDVSRFDEGDAGTNRPAEDLGAREPRAEDPAYADRPTEAARTSPSSEATLSRVEQAADTTPSARNRRKNTPSPKQAPASPKQTVA